MKKKSLPFKKFKVAKLQNPSSIFGGDPGDDTDGTHGQDLDNPKCKMGSLVNTNN